MKLFFIRHGQTDWNVKKLIQGGSDIELNAEGIRQAEELSQKLIKENYNFSKIYTSPQKRALKTAEILGQAVAMDFTPLEGLREICLGVWEGMSWAQVEEKYPEEYAAWHKNRRYAKPTNGESYEEMLQRICASLQHIIQENFEDVVIVTHSAVIMTLQCYITGTPFEKMIKFLMENASVTEIDSELLKRI